MASSTIITLLGWSVVLLIVQIVLAAGAVTRVVGLPAAMGPRDGGNNPPDVLSGRLTRSLHNLLETYPAFIALALALALSNKTTGLAAIGAHLWFWSRVAYVPVYAAGIAVVRTLIWAASILGLVLMLIALLS